MNKTHVLTLEAIGDNYVWATARATRIRAPVSQRKRMELLRRDGLKAMVKEVTGFNGSQVMGQLVAFGRDHTEANSVGSRGIKQVYLLENRSIYWIRQPISWSKSREFYAIVEDGDLIEISETEARSWLSKNH